MGLRSEELKEFAKKRGVDLVGIASIDRFDSVSSGKHPAFIFSDAKAVIVLGIRILRGALREMEEWTYWSVFRPGQRFGVVITDVPLAPDPLFEGQIWDRCKLCVSDIQLEQ